MSLQIRCPLCGMQVNIGRIRPRPPVVVNVKSKGRGLIKNIFLAWDSENPLYSVFQRRFYGVLEYLMRHGFIDASTVKKFANIYVKAPAVFHPSVIFTPSVVYNPEVVYSPNLLNEEMR